MAQKSEELIFAWNRHLSASWFTLRGANLPAQ